MKHTSIDYLTPTTLERLLPLNTSSITHNLPYLGEFRQTAKALRRRYPEITSHSASLELLSHTIGYPNWNTLRPKLKKGFVFEDVENTYNILMEHHYLDSPLTYDIETNEPNNKDAGIELVDKPYMDKEAGILCATFAHVENYYADDFIILVWGNGRNKPKRKLLTWKHTNLLPRLRYTNPDKFKEELQRIYDFETFFMFSERNDKRSAEERIKKNIQTMSKGDIFSCERNGMFFEVVSVSNKSFVLHEIDSVMIDTPECYEEIPNMYREAPIFFKPVPHSFKKEAKPFRKKLSTNYFLSNSTTVIHRINDEEVFLESMKDRKYLACSGVMAEEVEEMRKYSKRLSSAHLVKKKIEEEIEEGNLEKEIRYSFTDEDKDAFEKAMKHGYVYDKKQFAQRNRLPLWAEYKLALDSSPTIRAILAQKQFTAPLILELLAYDEKEHIRRSMTFNHSLTLDIAEILYQDSDGIRGALASSIEQIAYTESIGSVNLDDEKHIRFISLIEKILLDKDMYTYEYRTADTNFHRIAIDRIIGRDDREGCLHILDKIRIPDETKEKLNKAVGRK